MKETLDSELFRNADESIVKLVLLIKKTIKNTAWEDKVFLSGGTVRNLLLGINNDGTCEVVVEQRGGGIAFANWLAKKVNKYTSSANPFINEEWGIACMNIDADDDISDITLEISQTIKEWPENSVTPISLLYGTLEMDAKARDFTINTLYYKISEDKVIDKTGHGLDDLKNKIIRTASNATSTFKNSPVRILRGLRLSAQTGFSFSKSAWFAILLNISLIDKCEKRDIRSEMNKILLSNKPSQTLNRMSACGLLERILPDVHGLIDIEESRAKKTNYLSHTFDVVDTVFPTLANRYAALLHDVGVSAMPKGTKRDVDDFSAEYGGAILEDMGYKRSFIELVSLAIQNHRYFSMYGDNITPSAKKVRVFMDLCGDEYPTVLDLMNAENRCSNVERKPRQVLTILKLIETLEAQKANENDGLPINGNDIMELLQLKKGPIVGHIIKKVKNEFNKQTISTKDECLAFAKAEYDRLKDIL